MCKEHFGKDDIVIDGYRLNPVHNVDNLHIFDAETDFYMATGKDFYLLRLRNTAKNTITLCKHIPAANDFIYIIVEKQIQSDIDSELRAIVSELKKIDIPKKIYRDIVYKAFE